MENTKITNVKALENAINFLTEKGYDDKQTIEKLGNIKNSYVKKSSTTRKPTATQLLNEEIKVEILGVLNNEPNRIFTVTEVLKALTEEYSNQKISRLLSDLATDNKVVKISDKRKTFYQSIG